MIGCTDRQTIGVSATFPSGDMTQASAGQPNQTDTQPVYRWLLWTGVVVLAFVQAFVSFRGLDSPAGMDQAQLARELARGHPFQTKLIRPLALRQLTDAGSTSDLLSLRDTAQPPLPVLLLAPVMKLAEPWWPFDPTRRVYIMDRVIACMGALWLILSLVLTHGIATRLFDTTIAGFTILILALCLPLWEMAVGGSSRVLLLFLTSLLLHRLLEAARRGHAEEPLGLGMMLSLGLLAFLMTLSHWMAGWLAMGLAIAVFVLFPTGKGAGALMGAGVSAAIALVMARNLQFAQDPLGVLRAMLLGCVTTDSSFHHMRDFSGSTEGVMFGILIQKLNSNLRDVFSNSYLLFMGSIPALLGCISLLHRFRNPVVNTFRNAVFLAWLGVLVGAVLFGGQKDEVGDEQIHLALVPVFTALGLASLAVLWARLQTDRQTRWREYGYALIAVLISGWPMASGLYQGITVGLFYKDRQVQWPPYMPSRTALLTSMVDAKEILVSDQPWAVAWYADRSALWLPKDRPQFDAIRGMAEEQGHPVAGFLMSPVSSMEDRLHSQITGPYAPWSDLIFRAPLLGFGIDLGEVLKERLPYKSAFPLTGSVQPDGRFVPALIFYSDRVRWEHIK